MLGTILTIVIGVVVFMILVILHEFGHFTAARKCGMKVPEFGIGLPPRICKMRTDKQGTDYTLNRIPLGGFCSIEGEDPTDKKSFENSNTLLTAKLWKKLIVICAGVAMNFLTAWIILVCLFWHGVDPISVSKSAEEKGSTSYFMASSSFLREKGFLTGEVISGVVVSNIEEDSYAEKIGLQNEDIILSMDGNSINFSTFTDSLPKGTTGTHVFGVQRGEEEKMIEFSCAETDCTFGVVVSENGDITLSKIKYGFRGAMGAAFHEIGAERSLTMGILGDLGKAIISFKGSEMKTALNTLSGPVGAVKMGGMLYEIGGISAYLAFAAMISLALAFFNILPIPALDGGRGLGMILQSLFRIKPEKYFKYEGYVNAFFFYLILLLGIVLIFKDLIVFWGVNIPFISFN